MAKQPECIHTLSSHTNTTVDQHIRSAITLQVIHRSQIYWSETYVVIQQQPKDLWYKKIRRNKAMEKCLP